MDYFAIRLRFPLPAIKVNFLYKLNNKRGWDIKTRYACSGTETQVTKVLTLPFNSGFCWKFIKKYNTQLHKTGSGGVTSSEVPKKWVGIRKQVTGEFPWFPASDTEDEDSILSANSKSNAA